MFFNSKKNIKQIEFDLYIEFVFWKYSICRLNKCSISRYKFYQLIWIFDLEIIIQAADRIFDLEILIQSTDRIFDLKIIIWFADWIFDRKILVKSAAQIFGLDIEFSSFDTFCLILKIRLMSLWATEGFGCGCTQFI